MNSQLLFELSIALAVMAIIFSIYALTRPKYKPPLFSFKKASKAVSQASFPIYYAYLDVNGVWWGFEEDFTETTLLYARRKTLLYMISDKERKELVKNLDMLSFSDKRVELFPYIKRQLDDI